MKWDGIRHHTNLGNSPLFLISCLSARTAREYARRTLDRRLHLSLFSMVTIPFHWFPQGPNPQSGHLGSFSNRLGSISSRFFDRTSTTIHLGQPGFDPAKYFVLGEPLLNGM